MAGLTAWLAQATREGRRCANHCTVQAQDESLPARQMNAADMADEPQVNRLGDGPANAPKPAPQPGASASSR